MYILYTESSLQIRQLLLSSVPNTGVDNELTKLPNLPNLVSATVADDDGLYQKNVRSLKANTRYKTELCRQFYEMGYCEYRERCMFAHGKHELQTNVVRPRNYKTRICTEFQYKGYCAFGSRCSFVHEHKDPIELLDTVLTKYPRIPMPVNPTEALALPLFYPSDPLVRRTNWDMYDEECLLPSQFITSNFKRLPSFTKLTG